MRDKSLINKVAVVSGGGSGIGRASALLLAKHGAKVCFLDRSPDEAEKVIAEIKEQGGEAMVAETDVSNEEMVRKGIQAAADAWGRVDIVFANAGINGTWAPIEELSVEDWETTMDINLKGTFMTVKYAVLHLKKNGGSVIITSSINGNRTFSNFGSSAYSTSKAGQVAFMKMAALELAQFKIRVNAISPGAIETNIDENTNITDSVDKIEIPMKFPKGSQPLAQGSGSPEQVADLVLFLASDASSHITGTNIYIDGVESLLR
ncbi:SDR family oxidoreductase [Paenibacillus senegalensis]|uniref:SDR family oxidoreductase n=1 Tax=Paenibacillus senegalensis TaxID=1465766 RepID=UPI0002897E98|nr:SDR family NAD(P)-dependent oxidoreductase [Paenibacillus senegalensis]